MGSASLRGMKGLSSIAAAVFTTVAFVAGMLALTVYFSRLTRAEVTLAEVSSSTLIPPRMYLRPLMHSCPANGSLPVELVFEPLSPSQKPLELIVYGVGGGWVYGSFRFKDGVARAYVPCREPVVLVVFGSYGVWVYKYSLDPSKALTCLRGSIVRGEDLVNPKLCLDGGLAGGTAAGPSSYWCHYLDPLLYSVSGDAVKFRGFVPERITTSPQLPSFYTARFMLTPWDIPPSGKVLSKRILMLPSGHWVEVSFVVAGSTRGVSGLKVEGFWFNVSFDGNGVAGLYIDARRMTRTRCTYNSAVAGGSTVSVYMCGYYRAVPVRGYTYYVPRVRVYVAINSSVEILFADDGDTVFERDGPLYDRHERYGFRVSASELGWGQVSGDTLYLGFGAALLIDVPRYFHAGTDEGVVAVNFSWSSSLSRGSRVLLFSADAVGRYGIVCSSEASPGGGNCLLDVTPGARVFRLLQLTVVDEHTWISYKVSWAVTYARSC